MTKKDKTDKIAKALEKSKRKILEIIRKDALVGSGQVDEMRPKTRKDAPADADQPEKMHPQTRKEKKAERKAERQQKPLHKRIIKQTLKTVFIRIPLTILVLIPVVFIFLKLFLTPQRTESLIVSNFNKMSNGSIELNVREFSPYSGFIMENINIFNGSEFDGSKFVSIDRVVVQYDFFRFLTGSFRISEVGIYNPHIYLVEKNGVWNAEVLMKPSDQPKEEPEESAPLGEKISLPISVDLSFKFLLENLCVYVNGSGMRSSLEGFSTSARIIVPPTKEIPLSVQAVTLLDVMDVKVNPPERLNLSFYSKEAEVSPPLVFMLALDYIKGEGQEAPVFNSTFKCGTDRSPIRLKGTRLAPMNFLISYNLFYNPIEDRLNLEHLRVTFNGRHWINLGGTVNNLTGDPYVDIKMAESLIDLRALYPYYVSLTGDRSIRFGGELSLHPFSAVGALSSLNAAGSVTMRNISVILIQDGVNLSLPSFKFGYDVKLRGNDIFASADIDIPHIYYTLKGSKSGDNGFRLKADVKAGNMGQNITINNVSMRYYYPPSAADAVAMNMSGFVNLGDRISGKVEIPRLYVNIQPLKRMLPGRIAKDLEAVPLTKPVTINLSSDFNIGPVIEAGLSMLVKVPDFEINDLKLATRVRQDSRAQRVYLDSFSLSSAAWNAALKVSGRVDLKKAPISDSDIKLSLVVSAPQKRRLFNDIELGGLINISAAMKGDLNSGNVAGAAKIEKFNMNSDSMMLAVRDLNLNFPFKYYLKAGSGESMLSVRKNQIIDNDFFRQRPNFTIASVMAKHPARNIAIEYMKDFEAFMAFQDNIFQILNLKVIVLDGSLMGKRILFNIADLTMRNMEYLLELDATNIDINRLDKPLQKEKTRDAELSFNVNFSGKGVDVNRQLDATGYINIHKIGNDFANSLMKGLSETEGKSTLGIVQPVLDNTMSVRSFNFNLDRGLIYARVTLGRGIISYVFNTKIQDNRVDFERITIQEYLRRVRTGGDDERS
ncbi:MAG: AsmA family protein [Leptospirales bacterium]|nr:AsmA family protein [Leptospirales bacterium]